jgi:methyl-accepting chemotaxis protein
MRSAEAAKNTTRMIEESVSNARNGVSMSVEVGGALKDIVEKVGKANALIDEIALASNEQAKGIEQVNIAIGQMDKVTQNAAANAEESASAAEELSSQAEQMASVVEELNRMVVGQKAETVGKSQVKTKAVK